MTTPVAETPSTTTTSTHKDSVTVSFDPDITSINGEDIDCENAIESLTPSILERSSITTTVGSLQKKVNDVFVLSMVKYGICNITCITTMFQEKFSLKLQRHSGIASEKKYIYSFHVD